MVHLGKRKERSPLVETKLDRISSLPEHLIDDILSRLPVRDASRTSILSSEWRYRWAAIPSLEFDTECFPVSSKGRYSIRSQLVRIIDHVLLYHRGPIKKFKLSLQTPQRVADIDRWIGFISRSFIREFILEIWKGECYSPPSCLFDCQNLTYLELYYCTVKPPKAFKGFKNLKILDLQSINISQDVLENLITSCPMLEELTLFNFDGFTELNINAPNLQYLNAGGVFHNVSFQNTLNLAIVSMWFDEEIKHYEPEADGSKLLKFFANLPHIRRLEFHSYFLKYYLPCGNIPSSLPNKCLDMKYLLIHMNFNDLDETEAALCLLRSSPNLQELEMIARSEEPSARTYINFWGDHHWSSLFIHLRVVRVLTVSGIKSELDFISFLLSNAPALERMTVKPTSTDASLRLRKELQRFKRASLNLEINYLDL